MLREEESVVRGKRREEGRRGLDKKQMSDVASTTSVGTGTVGTF